MSRRTRIFAAILLIYVIGIAALLYRVMEDIDPRYRESAEESQVDMAHLMASVIEQDVLAGAINVQRLVPLFQSLSAREFSAQIYNLHKQRVELRVYVTDRAGRVLFDSTGRHQGQDFSQWRDVARTLNGQYGARATRDVESDPSTSVLYVAAPIRWADEIVGVVSVGKPVQSFGGFVQDARARTLWVGAGVGAALLVLALIVSVWLIRPFGVTADYLRWWRLQKGVSPLRMWRQAVLVVRSALQEMRDAVMGRNYVADYVQTFTHEIKSPLSAIRGAAELLQEEDMPAPERTRFLNNIEREARRVQHIVDRMMALTALEARRVLEHLEPVGMVALLEDAAASAQAVAHARHVRIELLCDCAAVVDGDRLLLHQAISNLLANAIDFSPSGQTVQVRLRRQGRRAYVEVRDHGPGIPDYAHDRIFQKFYSLARPHNQKKSTGLGLAFVQEIASLHHGRISLTNAQGGGALAQLSLPLSTQRVEPSRGE